MKRLLQKFLCVLVLVVFCYAGVLFFVALAGQGLVIVVLCIVLVLGLSLMWWTKPR